MASTGNEIDRYIANFQSPVRELLEELRTIIIKAAPQSQEIISYGMPAYRQHSVLVYFAAGKNHIGFYPTAAPIIEFQEELRPYKTSKGAIQFPLNKKIPKGLVTRIVKFRLLQDKEKFEEKLKTKRK